MYSLLHTKNQKITPRGGVSSSLNSSGLTFSSKNTRDPYKRAKLILNSLIIFSLAFLTVFLSSSHFLSTKSSDAITPAYYANITSSSPDLSFDVISTPDGVAKLEKDTLTVSTNAPAGYKLYISTKNNAPGTGLYLTDSSTTPAAIDTTKYLASSTGTPENPVTLETNTWGYVPSRRISTDQAATYTEADLKGTNARSIISGLPAYNKADVLYNNTTPSTSSSNTLDVYYGINVSTALPSGDYTNTVVYTAIVDEQTPSWEATISPISQEGLDAGTNLTIPTSLYPDIPVSEIGDITVKIGGNYATNVTPTINQNGKLIITAKSPASTTDGQKNVDIYLAKYNKSYTITNGYNYIVDSMQSFVPDPDAPKGTIKYLKDTRDNTIYKVAKLEDNNWWMAQDLKLGGDSDITLTPQDSNVSTNFTLKAENTDPWCMDSTSDCYDQSLMIKTGVPNGYLYNWYAATAGTGTYSVSSGNVSSSICPKGWTLPTSGAGGQFAELVKAYGGDGENHGSGQEAIVNNLMATPIPGMNWTGFYSGHSINYPSDAADYWSRTVVDSAGAYSLGFTYYGQLLPQNNDEKYYGQSVRCIKQDTMQNFTPDPTAAVGTTKELVDLRDNKTYTVGKLADGNWWMVENLKLTGSRTLTSTDSNVSSNYDLPASSASGWCTGSSEACYNAENVLDSGNANYGVYYSWAAATAGTGKYSITSGNASASICPRGWRLPAGGGDGDFANLDIAMGGTGKNRSDSTQSTKLRAVDGPALVLSGNRSGSNTTNQNSVGYYWSSTTNANYSAYILNLNSSAVRPQLDINRYYGLAVRCVRDLPTMQDFEPDQAATKGTIKELKDARDNKPYTVAKLEDGNWWMVKDLKLGGDTDMTLTSADSNVSTPFTLKAENTGTWCTEQSAECYNQSLMIKFGVPNGYLYNWYAATAGTGTYETSTGNAASDICPKSWSLPTGGPGGQFSALSVAYGGPADNQDGQQTAISNLMASPTPGLNWTGYQVDGSTLHSSDEAYYWSRTVDSPVYAYYLAFIDGGTLYPQANYNRYYGFAIRCLKS